MKIRRTRAITNARQAEVHARRWLPEAGHPTCRRIAWLAAWKHRSAVIAHGTDTMATTAGKSRRHRGGRGHRRHDP